MKCFICNSQMDPYFKTDFGMDWIEKPYQYIRCPHCGLVVSETVYGMTMAEWGEINQKCHEYINGGVDERDPKWLQRTTNQAKMFANLFIDKVFDSGMRCVDYACGSGMISEIFDRTLKEKGAENCGKIEKYEKYTNFSNREDFLGESDMVDGSFDMVTSSSVFEHLAGKKEVDKILRLLKGDGTLCLQTLVCEEVPNDSKWFYLAPVHCTLWTNKAMDIFFRTYKFVGCVYNLSAQMWLMFRNPSLFEKLKETYDKENDNGVWTFSDKFVDYYKNKPYR